MTEFPAACVPHFACCIVMGAHSRPASRARASRAGCAAREPVADETQPLASGATAFVSVSCGKRCEKERGNGYGSRCEGLRERRRCGWDGDVPHPCGDLRRERGVRDRARSAYDARAERARLGRVDRARLGRRRCERGDGGARCDGPLASRVGRDRVGGRRARGRMVRGRARFPGQTSWRRDISSSDCFKRPSPSKCAGDGWGSCSKRAGERAARCGTPRSGNAPDRHFALE